MNSYTIILVVTIINFRVNKSQLIHSFVKKDRTSDFEREKLLKHQLQLTMDK